MPAFRNFTGCNTKQASADSKGNKAESEYWMKQITTVMVKRYPGTQRHLGILVKVRYAVIC